MNNGGCDSNAICSRDTKTNVIKCTCKPGYTNVGANSTVVCKGTTNHWKTTFKRDVRINACLDSCQVNNGGCDSRANCTRDSATNAIKCICRAGFVNTGTDSKVVCTGNYRVIDRFFFCFSLVSSNDVHHIFQMFAEWTTVDVIRMLPVLLIARQILFDARAELVIRT